MKRVTWISSIFLILALVCLAGEGEGEDGTISQIVRAGQPTPDTTATFTPLLEILGFNNEGQVAFLSSHSGTTDTALNRRIFVGSPGNLTEIIRTGQSAPDRNGTFSSLAQMDPDPQCYKRFYEGFSQSQARLAFPDTLNSKGQLAFLGMLNGTTSGEKDNTGIFLSSGRSILQIVRTGQSVPDGSGVFSGFSLPVVNSDGVVAFGASVLGPGGRGRDCTMGIFLANDTSLIQIMRSKPVSTSDPALITGLGGWALNNKNQVAFVGYLSRERPNGVLYLAKGNSLIEIVRAGQPTPDGNGQFLDFDYPALNDQGLVAFHSVLTGTKGGTSDNDGIFLAKSGRLLQIARSGMSAPDGNGTVFRLSGPQLNNVGQVTFVVTYTGTSGGGRDNTAIFHYTEGAGLKQIARAGPRAPDGNGRIAIVGQPRINVRGQVAFEATFVDTREGSSDTTGIFVGDGDTIAEIVRAGQPAPDGNGKFSAVGPPLLNDAGQIAFNGTLQGTSQAEYDYSGIYIWSSVPRK